MTLASTKCVWNFFGGDYDRYDAVKSVMNFGANVCYFILNYKRELNVWLNKSIKVKKN